MCGGGFMFLGSFSLWEGLSGGGGSNFLSVWPLKDILLGGIDI